MFDFFPSLDMKTWLVLIISLIALFFLAAKIWNTRKHVQLGEALTQYVRNMFFSLGCDIQGNKIRCPSGSDFAGLGTEFSIYQASERLLGNFLQQLKSEMSGPQQQPYYPPAPSPQMDPGYAQTQMPPPVGQGPAPQPPSQEYGGGGGGGGGGGAEGYSLSTFMSGSMAAGSESGGGQQYYPPQGGGGQPGPVPFQPISTSVRGNNGGGGGGGAPVSYSPNVY